MTGIDSDLNLDMGGAGGVCGGGAAVKFPIYFSYVMDLVDLIIFTVGDPRGCRNELLLSEMGAKK